MTSLRQLYFSFADAVKEKILPSKPVPARAEAPRQPLSGSCRDESLESQARGWLATLGMREGAGSLRVVWNPRLRSTAGYAKWPDWLVELNPRLKEFEGQVERTLKHE